MLNIIRLNPVKAFFYKTENKSGWSVKSAHWPILVATPLIVFLFLFPKNNCMS